MSLFKFEVFMEGFGKLFMVRRGGFARSVPLAS